MSRSFLSDEATQDFHELLRRSLWFGIIGPETYLSRLTALIDLSRRSCPASFYARTLLHAEGWSNDEPAWPEGNDDGEIDRGSGTMGDGAARMAEPDDIQFIPSASTGLHGWFFRIGDPDPIPSVPHGHGRKDERYKLDPYQGFISRAGRQTGREPRGRIVGLWNDTQFRQFAFRAIQHFKLAYGHWRPNVNDPLVLPRRRRSRKTAP